MSTLPDDPLLKTSLQLCALEHLVMRLALDASLREEDKDAWLTETRNLIQRDIGNWVAPNLDDSQNAAARDLMTAHVNRLLTGVINFAQLQ